MLLEKFQKKMEIRGIAVYRIPGQAAMNYEIPEKTIKMMNKR